MVIYWLVTSKTKQRIWQRAWDMHRIRIAGNRLLELLIHLLVSLWKQAGRHYLRWCYVLGMEVVHLSWYCKEAPARISRFLHFQNTKLMYPENVSIVFSSLSLFDFRNIRRVLLVGFEAREHRLISARVVFPWPKIGLQTVISLLRRYIEVCLLTICYGLKQIIFQYKSSSPANNRPDAKSRQKRLVMLSWRVPILKRQSYNLVQLRKVPKGQQQGIGDVFVRRKTFGKTIFKPRCRSF